MTAIRVTDNRQLGRLSPRLLAFCLLLMSEAGSRAFAESPRPFASFADAVRADPACAYSFESCVHNGPGPSAVTSQVVVSSASAEAAGGSWEGGSVLVVRLPPVEDASPYGSLPSAPAASGPTEHWDGDDSVPGSFDSSDSGFRDTVAYVYDKTLSGFKESSIEMLIDYQNLVSYRSIGLLGISLGTAGALANTHLDTRFTEWNDKHINGALSNEAARDFKLFGDGQYMIPIFVVAAFSGPFVEESIPAYGPVGQWGNRSIQAMLATGPLTLFFNQALGSSRPVADEGSKWRPFHDSHGVSGHAFMGAIPFLTAASMTDNYAAKTGLFLLSFGAGWSRIHDDQHYLSEVLMGWSLAWIGVDAVNRTKGGRNDFIVSPAMLSGGTPGIHFAFNF